MKCLLIRHTIKQIGEVKMNSEIRLKNDVYKAIGYTTLLVASAIPFSILGMQMLNFVLGHIKV